MGFEVMERGVKLRMELLIAYTADDAASGAISTVAGASIRHQKQYPVGIAMHQPGNRHMRIFAAGIDHVIGRRPRLFDPGDDLAPNWILGISSQDKVKKMRRDRER